MTTQAPQSPSVAKVGPTSVQILEDQKKRLAALQERRTRVQVKLETEALALATASAEAVEKFGTADLKQLRQMYKDRSLENERLVAEFTDALNTAEQQLSDIERQIKL